jgi:SAM-dependent methyltransferase
MSSESEPGNASPRAPSPFGGTARHLLSLPTAYLIELYRSKCGVHVSAEFEGAESVHLYECDATGYRFWQPEHVAGSERLYAELSRSWPDYYRTDRWEYSLAGKHVRSGDRILEIGCGRGYFLARMERTAREAIGLELNSLAIAETVASAEVKPMTVEALAASGETQFDSVWSFQVLEHVSDPASLIRAGLACLRPGGLLGLSTPNGAHRPFIERDDPLDMPPHHVGHFSEAVYRRIADLVGVEVIAIHQQVRGFEPETVTEGTRRSLPYRVARRLSHHLINAAYAWSQEPGPGILAVFRKPQ